MTNCDNILASRGAAYRDSQIANHSYYNTPLQSNGVRGNSRVWGDASTNTQRSAINAIINAGRNHGMTAEQITLTTAIARHESGFNPDAAAGTTSANGIGQFVNRTGAHYDLTDANRWDINAQADALVRHTLDNIRLAERRGQGTEYVYAYHHDGPSLQYGGLELSRQHIMPKLEEYGQILRDCYGL